MRPAKGRIYSFPLPSPAFVAQPCNLVIVSWTRVHDFLKLLIGSY
jgi:hypothetical protein